MSDAAPSSKNPWVTIAVIIGGFAIFALILVVAYLPQKPAPLPEGARTPEERAILITELRAKEKTATTTYAWIDQPAGVVRLPIDRAVELTIQEARAKAASQK